MSIRTTDRAHVALFDSTTMEAFGPVFESSAHADDFLTWLPEAGHPDPTAYRPSDLAAAHETWLEARCDTDGNLLPA